MAKAPKLTFKKCPRETGFRAVGNPYPWVDIKFGGKKVGSIIPPNWHSREWRVQIAIEEEELGNPDCPWRWEMFGSCATEEEARVKAQESLPRLLAGRGLHFFD